MRSPWLIGGAVLAWLPIAGLFGHGAVGTLVLWILGVALAAIFLTGLKHQSRPASPDPLQNNEQSVGEDELPRPTTTRNTSSESSIADRAPAVSQGDSAQKETELLVRTSGEIAALLRIDENIVIEAMREGHLPGNQLRGEWRCSEASLRRWLDGRWT